jgi:hypothetical protein
MNIQSQVRKKTKIVLTSIAEQPPGPSATTSGEFSIHIDWGHPLPDVAAEGVGTEILWIHLKATGMERTLLCKQILSVLDHIFVYNNQYTEESVTQHLNEWNSGAIPNDTIYFTTEQWKRFLEQIIAISHTLNKVTLLSSDLVVKPNLGNGYPILRGLGAKNPKTVERTQEQQQQPSITQPKSSDNTQKKSAQKEQFEDALFKVPVVPEAPAATFVITKPINLDELADYNSTEEEKGSVVSTQEKPEDFGNGPSVSSGNKSDEDGDGEVEQKTKKRERKNEESNDSGEGSYSCSEEHCSKGSRSSSSSIEYTEVWGDSSKHTASTEGLFTLLIWATC